MRKKELKLIITFSTTSDAIGMEKTCIKNSIPGRLIPVPRSISAGCGLAWCAPLEAQDELKSALKKHLISHEKIHTCMV